MTRGREGTRSNKIKHRDDSLRGAGHVTGGREDFWASCTPGIDFVSPHTALLTCKVGSAAQGCLSLHKVQHPAQADT